MDNLVEELRVFVRVAERGNFSRAARDLRISQPSASRLVADLERRLGTTLLLRTTHELAPTDAGRAYLDHARAILAGIDAAADAVRRADGLSGVLRIAAPAAFGTRTIVPIVAAFLREHPMLTVELSPIDEAQPLVAQAVDVAIRFGRLTGSEFGARRLATLDRVAVAAPAYLSARGMPARPRDLAGHDGIFGPGPTGRSAWLFGPDRIRPEGVIERVMVATAEGVVACARVGMGIAVATRALCRDDIAAGTLIQVLADDPLQPVDVHAVLPAGRIAAPKVRAFVDRLVETLERDGR